MTYVGLWRWLGLSFALALIACSPALNWREVRLEGLTAMLPCKPDHAVRTVRLGADAVEMEMAGCEAADALYAISHVRSPDATQSRNLQVHWRTAILGNLQAKSVQTRDFKLAKAPADAYQVPFNPTVTDPGAQWELLWAQGQREDASTVQARLLWFSIGADTYHVAVYGARLTPEAVDMLYSDLRLQ